MGLFSSLLGTSAYNDTLKSFGISPGLIPTSANARICSLANERTQRMSKIDPSLGGFSGRDVNMSYAARITAFCILGPSEYRSIGGDYASIKESIEHAAEVWERSGSGGSMETKIISILSDAGVVSDEFTDYFNSMH